MVGLFLNYPYTCFSTYLFRKDMLTIFRKVVFFPRHVKGAERENMLGSYTFLPLE